MKILYCAIDQTVPGTTGGSIHVQAVAEGLAALGHQVYALVSPGDGDFPAGAVRWIPMTPPFGARELRWARAGAVRRIARLVEPDVIIERYYNFGGEGMAAAHIVGATAVLEVNAPVIDHPGSIKAAIDRALIVQPMRRWRERLVARAHLIVTPSAAILPPHTPAARILEVEWGADTDRFRPDAKGTPAFARRFGILAAFAGAFRRWHGAIHLARAIRELQGRNVTDIGAVFIGDGPELPSVRAEAEGLDDVIFTGSVAHERMPACLAAADVGVAPFDVGTHGPLALGFYWSPLKVFEYMATGLPVVAPAIDRIGALVGHEREGILYDPGRPSALAGALERMRDPALRARLGAAARARAVTEYGWKTHCDMLNAAIEKVRRKTSYS
jgi:glycosyltransferase involved in cell wall biosynthesis